MDCGADQIWYSAFIATALGDTDKGRGGNPPLLLSSSEERSETGGPLVILRPAKRDRGRRRRRNPSAALCLNTESATGWLLRAALRVALPRTSSSGLTRGRWVPPVCAAKARLAGG